MIKWYRVIRCWLGIHNYELYTIGVYCTRCDKRKELELGEILQLLNNRKKT